MGHFLYAAKAFDIIEKIDHNPENWEGKRGSCCGVLQMVIAGKENKYRRCIKSIQFSLIPNHLFIGNQFRKY